jgi:hypothetical protein
MDKGGFFDSFDSLHLNVGSLYTTWNKYGLEILAFVTLCSFIIYGIFNKLYNVSPSTGTMTDPRSLLIPGDYPTNMIYNERRIDNNRMNRTNNNRMNNNRMNNNRTNNNRMNDDRTNNNRMNDDRMNDDRKSRMSKGEAECKRVLENIFHQPFVKVRPKFLKNPLTNKNLELDLYNQNLRFACEYNGEQHYVQSKIFNNESLADIQYRDQLKSYLCMKHNIYLVVVPYTIKHKDIESFIIKHVLNWRDQSQFVV